MNDFVQEENYNVTIENRLRHTQALCPHTLFKCPKCGKYRDNLHNHLRKENIALKVVVQAQQRIIESLVYDIINGESVD